MNWSSGHTGSIKERNLFAVIVRVPRGLYGLAGCCVIGQNPLMQSTEVIGAILDHHGGGVLVGEATDQDMDVLAPDPCCW